MARRRRLSLAEAQRTGSLAEFARQAEAEGIAPIGEAALIEAARRINNGSASAAAFVPFRRGGGL
jgi:hypothetical protein